MNLKTKIGIVAIALLLMSLIGFIIYNQVQISKRQEAINTQMTSMKQLGDNIARAQTSWATKEDLDNIAKQNNLNLKPIKDDLETLNASLTAINIVSVKSNPQIANNLKSTSTTPNPNPQIAPPIDTFGYFNNRQVLKLDEKFADVSVPIGEVGFSSWQEKPWDINLEAREYKISTVLGTDENQKQYAYNKFVIKVSNKEYPVKISNNTFSQEYPMPKFSFNPRLYLGINGGLDVNQIHGEVTPDISLGLLSYGKYKGNNPDLTFLDIGVGYGINSKKPQIVLTPITYNIGGPLPLLDNLHVGPTVQVGTNGDFGVGIAFRVGL